MAKLAHAHTRLHQAILGEACTQRNSSARMCWKPQVYAARVSLVQEHTADVKFGCKRRGLQAGDSIVSVDYHNLIIFIDENDGLHLRIACLFQPAPSNINVRQFNDLCTNIKNDLHSWHSGNDKVKQAFRISRDL
jgi:hypothetical protein